MTGISIKNANMCIYIYIDLQCKSFICINSFYHNNKPIRLLHFHHTPILLMGKLKKKHREVKKLAKDIRPARSTTWNQDQLNTRTKNSNHSETWPSVTLGCSAFILSRRTGTRRGTQTGNTASLWAGVVRSPRWRAKKVSSGNGNY